VEGFRDFSDVLVCIKRTNHAQASSHPHNLNVFIENDPVSTVQYGEDERESDTRHFVHRNGAHQPDLGWREFCEGTWSWWRWWNV
jgi:hypothetical protein